MEKLKFLIILFICIFFFQEAQGFDLDIGVSISKPVKNFKQLKTQHVVKQSLDYSCGPAALATLFNYFFDEKITENEIIKTMLVTVDLEKVKERKGFSLLDLKKFAETKGYEVVGYKMDLDYLVELNKPVLVPVRIKDYSHFIIFRGLIDDRVFLADPALGKMTMKVEKFTSLWENGVGLVLSKDSKKKTRSPLKLAENEKAIFADPDIVRQTFGMNTVGSIVLQGDFN